MSEAASETSCDWTVTGMDCGSCATKIKDAVARLPGVSGVEVGIRVLKRRRRHHRSVAASWRSASASSARAQTTSPLRKLDRRKNSFGAW